MKIWITKYALTKGIYEADAKIDGNMATVRNPNSQWDQYFHSEGKDYCKTFAAAQQRAETMRLNTIQRLEKQLRLLREMTFHEQS